MARVITSQRFMGVPCSVNRFGFWIRSSSFELPKAERVRRCAATAVPRTSLKTTQGASRGLRDTPAVTTVEDDDTCLCYRFGRLMVARDASGIVAHGAPSTFLRHLFSLSLSTRPRLQNLVLTRLPLLFHPTLQPRRSTDRSFSVERIDARLAHLTEKRMPKNRDTPRAASVRRTSSHEYSVTGIAPGKSGGDRRELTRTQRRLASSMKSRQCIQGIVWPGRGSARRRYRVQRRVYGQWSSDSSRCLTCCRSLVKASSKHFALQTSHV